MRVLYVLIFAIVIFSSFSTAQSIPAFSYQGCKIATGYTFNNIPGFLAYSIKEACDSLGMDVVNIPGVEACMTENGGWFYVQSGDICSDGSFKIPRDRGWCNDIKPTCPNGTWTLSSDRMTCLRSDDACYVMTDEEAVSEEKLLATIAYGEASTLDVYEEMAAIASATVNRRDASKFSSVNKLVKRFPSFSYAVTHANIRFRQLMCADSEKGLKKLIMQQEMR